MSHISRPLGRVRLPGRFEVERELGRGGFGTVLQAFDHDRGERVALKILDRFGASPLLQFKREFRNLQGIDHPNLVRIDELFEHEGTWFFSMELVEGTGLLEWVRGAENDSPCNMTRLRDGVRQLARGLGALHQAGLLHRDIKPDNVRVDRAGRVVLLDFGLVAHLTPGADSTAHAPVGTAAYMAPEQANQAPVGPEADWYAVGVLLFELLTGTLPFDGGPLETLVAKSTRAAPRPSERTSGLPGDLERLCIKLLKIDPAERATGRDVQRVLNMSADLSPTAHSEGTATRSELFVGRELELEWLRQHHRASRTDGLRLAVVQGESGVGKSALTRCFTEEVAAKHPNALVLSGHCYEQENVSYKAFDGIVDELSRYLRRHPNPDAVLPAKGWVLTRVFPVLGRVEALSTLTPGPAPAEPTALRLMAFDALLELFRRVGMRQQVVLCIDDLQWADRESLRLLQSLLDAPDPPPMFVVATARPLEDVEPSLAAPMRALVEHERSDRLDLWGLTPEDTRQLAQELLGANANAQWLDTIDSEAQGHPFFIGELARQAGLHALPGAVADLETTLLARVDQLDAGARTLLEILALAVTPVPRSLVARHFGAAKHDFRACLNTLRGGKLVRSAGRGKLTCSHDRVREIVAASLDRETARGHHRTLAHMLETDGDVDPATLAAHWLGAGNADRALPCLVAGAERAAEALAFDRASGLYEQARDHATRLWSTERRQALEVHFAQALADAGRPRASAQAYRAALEHAEESEKAALHSAAAQQLLQCAEVAEGLEVAEAACEHAGLPWSKNLSHAFTRLLWHRTCVAARGFDAQLKDPSELTPRVQIQLDVAWSLSMQLAWSDIIRGAEMTARHLRLALKTGHRRHLARALAQESLFRGMQKPRHCDQHMSLVDRADALARDENDEELAAFVQLMRGATHLCAAELSTAQQWLERGLDSYLQFGSRSVWMTSNARALLGATLWYRGETASLAANASRWVREADARSDRFAFTVASLTSLGCLRHLADDEPGAVREEIAHALDFSAFERKDYALFMGGCVEASVRLYEGGPGAARFFDASWAELKTSLMVRTPFARSIFVLLQGLAEAAAAVEGDESSRRVSIKRLRAHARDLRRLDNGWSRGGQPLLEAQCALLEGDRERAVRAAQTTVDVYAEHGALYGMCAEYALGKLLGGQEGGQRCAHFESWAREQGWRDPERLAHAFFPTVELIR